MTLELPVLNRNQGPIAQAAAKRTEAAARFAAAQAGVLAELDRALASFRAAQSQRADTQALGRASQSRRQSVEAQAQAGAADQIEVLNARWEELSAQLTEWESQIREQSAAGALEDAVQQPLPEIERATKDN